MELKYQAGFGNHFETEAQPGALPSGQNSPQKLPYNLYAEQLSGSAFTVPRKDQARTWLYREHPSVNHRPYVHTRHSGVSVPNKHTPNQLRWFPYQKWNGDFIESLQTYVGNGSPESQSGCMISLYACDQNMSSVFYSADGDWMIVPQSGRLLAKTEMGRLVVGPTEILVIPRGIKFQIDILDKKATGYVCENFGAHFTLPDLGPIGANGLAHPRDFLAPLAQPEYATGPVTVVAKYLNQFWKYETDHTPLNVVAWQGNYYPYKYDLKKFNTINTVSFDHPDPSIFTVLTSPSSTVGMANLDFVIFPPRWMVAEHTFRPPYYHRNIMSEFMGLIEGQYDAKSGEFAPGGASLHNVMSAHGPDLETFNKASLAELQPERYKNTLAFMFESRYPFAVTDWALSSDLLDKNYYKCWLGL